MRSVFLQRYGLQRTNGLNKKQGLIFLKMDIEVYTTVDPYDVFENMSPGQQVEFLSNVLDDLSRSNLHDVLDNLWAEAVITAFDPKEICDSIDDEELVVELENRGWKLVKDKNE